MFTSRYGRHFVKFGMAYRLLVLINILIIYNFAFINVTTPNRAKDNSQKKKN